jgi:hypothetical protein
MVNANGKVLNVDGNHVEVEYTIRQVLEYSTQVIVLIYDNVIIPNNIISFDKNGNELWKINDILEIQRPTGNVDIQKEDEEILIVYSSLGMIFRIDIQKKKLIDKQFLR